MPPRFAYWTILIDNAPTAFRAHDAQDLMPTLAQLKHTNPTVVMKWFARGRLWDSPEEARAASRAPTVAAEKRSRDWRPGGQHKDPRDRFKKKNRQERAWSNNPIDVRRDREKLGPPREARSWREKPAGPPHGDRPWQNTPSRSRPNDRPWQTKPTGPRKDRQPWKPAGAPRGDRPWQKRPGPRTDDPDKD